MKMDTLLQKNRHIAIFIDSMDRFYTDGGTDAISSNIRRLIINRKKMKVMLFFTSITDYSDFEIGRNRATSVDYWWMKSGDREWRQYLDEVEIDLGWNYLQSTHIEPRSYDVHTPTVDWTDIEKESGWFCDYEGDSSVLRCSKDFNFNGFWRGLENVSSVSVPDYLHDFLAEGIEPAQTLDQQGGCGHEKDRILFAVKLKSIGLTDEAIEYLMGMPKTTLRRHAEMMKRHPSDVSQSFDPDREVSELRMIVDNHSVYIREYRRLPSFLIPLVCRT